MEPRIIDQGEMTFVGMIYYGNPFSGGAGAPAQNEIGKLWTRFNTWSAIATASEQNSFESSSLHGTNRRVSHRPPSSRTREAPLKS